MRRGGQAFCPSFRVQFLSSGKQIFSRLIHGENNRRVDGLTHELTKTASLYIHWPFCRHICPYCNFNKYKSENVDYKRMENCLRKVQSHQIKLFNIEKINSIFFGGGTPSLCEPSTIEKLINDVHKSCTVRRDLEVSLEANPSSHFLHKLRSFKAAGVNRVSIGVQALNDADLRMLGRDHNVQDAVMYLKEAAEIFGNRISIDLMFGRPGQTLEKWKNELKMALDLSSMHISLYQLTMERSTPMERMHRRGEVVLPEHDLIADMYSLAVEYIEDAGLERYEVANFARKGSESQHNISYWSGGQYIGIGPGAHGRIHISEDGFMRRTSTIQSLVPDTWMNKVDVNGHGMQKMDKLTILQTLEELFLQGMRMKAGVDEKVIRIFSGGRVKLEEMSRDPAIKQLLIDGFLEADDRGLRTTHSGMALLDAVMTDVCLSIEDILAAKEKFV